MLDRPGSRDLTNRDANIKMLIWVIRGILHLQG